MYQSATLARRASPPKIRTREIVLPEGVIQLGDEVVDVLDAYRQAHQAFIDSEVGAHVLGQRSVSHDGRMLDQALDAAEAFGEREKLAALEEAARGAHCAFLAALEHCRHHAAIALVHLACSEQVLRMACKPRIDDPLDLRVLRALRSPFEIDIYVWLTWRFFRLRKPVTIPWASLALQFGSCYANPRHFKKRFLGYLRGVIDYYPDVRLEDSDPGLVLKPSPPHVPPRTAPVKL